MEPKFAQTGHEDLVTVALALYRLGTLAAKNTDWKLRLHPKIVQLVVCSALAEKYFEMSVKK